MAQDPDDADQSERLSREEGDALRNLLLYLRYVLRHQFVAIAQKVNVSTEKLWQITAGRSRGTKNLREKIYKYAEERHVPIDIATGLGAHHGFRAELNISDETLTKDSVRLAGRYLNYTLLNSPPNQKVGVTLVTLYRKEEGDSLPEFAAWRPDFRIKGYYYFYDGIIYLIGHAVMTGYPRLLCMEPIAADDFDNFVGTVCTASRDNIAFHSMCYMKKTTPHLIKLRRKNWSMLGIFELKKLEKDAQDVALTLRGKQVLQIPRRPDLNQGAI